MRSAARTAPTICSLTVTATISRADRPELATGDLLDDDDRVRPLGDEAGVEEVAREHAEQPVAELLVVDQHPLVGIAQPARRARVEHGQPLGPFVVPADRDVRVRDAGLLVRVQVVRRVEQREHVREAVADEPDQLLLAPHLAVVAREPARALGGGEPVLDDPAERARLEPLRPASLHATGPARRASRISVSNPNRLGDRPHVVHPHDGCAAIERPHDGGERRVVASIGASGSASPLASATTRPRNVLREVPTSTGTSTRATSSSRRASRSRLCSTRLAEADAGIGAQRLGRDPRGARDVRAARRGSRRPRHDVVVARARAASCAARPACAWRRTPAPARGDDVEDVGIGAAGGHVVHDRRSGLERGGRHRGLAGVDAHGHLGLGGQATRRPATPGGALRASSTGIGTGTGRLAADVEQIGARRRPAASPCATAAIGVEVAAAVGERVGRDVDDAHHRGSVPAEGRARRTSVGTVPGRTSPRDRSGMPDSYASRTRIRGGCPGA